MNLLDIIEKTINKLGNSDEKIEKSNKIRKERPNSAMRRTVYGNSSIDNKINTINEFNVNKPKKIKISKEKLAPIDPKLYKVDLDEVKKEYDKIKSSQNKNKRIKKVNDTPMNGNKLNTNSQNINNNSVNVSKEQIKKVENEKNIKNIKSNNRQVRSIIKDRYHGQKETSVESIDNSTTNLQTDSELNKLKISIEYEKKPTKNYSTVNNSTIIPNINENSPVDRGASLRKLSALHKVILKNRQKKSTPKKKIPIKQLLKNIIPINIGRIVNRRSTIAIKNKFNEDISKYDENKKKEALLDNTKCVLCLKRVKFPVILKCKHEICLDCSKEVKSIYEFLKDDDENYSSLFIKCVKCSEKTFIPGGSFESLLRRNWMPLDINLTTSANLTMPSSTCEICPSSKAIRDYAEFECLNCDILICYECKLRHISNPRHQDHKIIQVVKLVQEKIELTLCDQHREPMKLYCLTEGKPCCLVCSNYENLHEGHIVKSIRTVIENSATDLSLAIRECEMQFKKIDTSISSMQNIKDSLESEQNAYIAELTQVTENIISHVKERELKISEFIKKTFSDKLKSLDRKLNVFSLLSSRYNYYKTMICDRDIDILDRISQLKILNENILKLEKKESLLWNNNAKIDSLKGSTFTDNPTEKIVKTLEKFEFLPLVEKHYSILRNMFSDSNVIKSELINSQFIITLPKIKSGFLLYKISRDGPGTQLFHELCDNKGPTITLIRLDDGHIFGGYNPISWINEYMYNETEEAFLFSITDSKYRQPIRCPIKKSLKKYAIKQNENAYSPGFGETDQADLLISYKNLNKSYSQLGNVYKCPKGYNPKEFLAGRPSDWKIADVEVYAVEVLTNKEFGDILRS